MQATHREAATPNPLTQERTQVLKNTWAMVTPIGETAATLFYTRLFEIDPTTRTLFEGVNMPAQRQKLLTALDKTVNGLDCPEQLLPELESLGRRHAGYGVVDSHYDSVGAALLWTLEQGLGSAWTQETQQAWADAYALISNVMRNAKVDVASAIDAPVTVTTCSD